MDFEYELGDEVICSYRQNKTITKVVGVKSNNSGIKPLYLIENLQGFVLDSNSLSSLSRQPNTIYAHLEIGKHYSWIDHENLELPKDSLRVVVEAIKEEIKVKIDHNFQYIK